MDEGELIERCRDGDPAALEALVAGHLHRTYLFAFKLTGHHADAEDLTQEAFFRAIPALEGFRGETTFRSWLFRILLNLFRDGRKAAVKRESSLDAIDEEPPSKDPEPLVWLVGCDEAALIVRKMVELPPVQRMALMLRTFQGLSYDEIAAILETTRDSIKTSIHLARRRLLGESLPEPEAAADAVPSAPMPITLPPEEPSARGPEDLSTAPFTESGD